MQRGTNTPHSNSLAQVVCAWSTPKLSQLAKEFSDSCAPPVVSFPSYDRYKAYFEPLLLAEVSADLLSVVEKFHRSAAPRFAKVRARREEAGGNIALVAVQNVTRVHNYGFGWVVDLDSHDRKGPVGSVDNDVVALWLADPAVIAPDSRQTHATARSARPVRSIPDSSVLGVVVRASRNGCRVVLTKFPDGNENGVRTDLEDGEENEEEPPPLRLWNCLRLSSLTTMRREFEALQKIKTSVLLPTLLRPHSQSSAGRQLSLAGDATSAAIADGKPLAGVNVASDTQHAMHRNEETFTHVISNKTGLNPSQTRAIFHASTCRGGFSVIQGPPGTGKTRTLISLLNVVHMAQYQEYYEGLLESLEPLHGSSSLEQRAAKTGSDSSHLHKSQTQKEGSGSLLENMMMSMNKKMLSSADPKRAHVTTRARRPRLLICAPSNSAVDEVLTRLTKAKFIDGQGRSYCPELARIGAGDRVSEAAKPFTAEGQAEAFLDRVCAEDMNPEARKNAQMAFMATWQGRCNSLLVQLERTPKKQASSRPVIIDLHEKLERMDRDLRRLSIAASDGPKSMSREEKLRQIARTYVEDAQLVFATLSGSASSILTKKATNDVTGALFDTVVIDEGAQATETSCLIPMALGASRCILVGDPQQLPATVLSSGAAGLAYGQSLLERVCRGGQSVQLLDTQYRMHPAISSFPRRYFYNGRLVDDESVQGENRARPFHRDAIRPKLGPYVFLDISEGEERRSKDDRSIFNRAEAELASLIYTKLKKEYSDDSLFSLAAKMHGSVTGFGVVTPYKRQMQELRQSFDRAGIPTGDVEIDTVDSFQGREKDVIVFSCVRTASANSGIGFVRDVRRMNVGLTRARASLIVLGSAQALAEGSSDWAELVEDASSRGCLISISNVGRCLNPSPLDMSPVAVPEKPAVLPANTTAPNGVEAATKGAITGYTGQNQRKSNTSVPADPRRRAPKRESAAERKQPVPGLLRNSPNGALPPAAPSASDISTRSFPPEGNLAAVVALNSSRSVQTSSAKEYVQKNPAPPFNSDPPYVNTSDTKSPELQATLKQVSNMFTGTLVQNRKQFEEIMEEHVRSGGALDVETVIAAAISTNNRDDTQPAPQTGSNLPLLAANGVDNIPRVGPVPQQNLSQLATATPHENPIQPSGSRHGVLPEPAVLTRPHAAGKVLSGPNDRKTKTRSRGGKVHGKDGPVSKKRAKSEKKQSGWDMLFSKDTAPAGAVATRENGSSETLQQPPNVDGARASRKSQVIADKDGGVQQQARNVNPSSAVPDGDTYGSSHENAGWPDQRNAREQFSSGDARNVWNDQSGRGYDRKQGRDTDQYRGNSSRGRARNERLRGRGKRGRTQEDGNYGMQPPNDLNESWVPAPYDPNYGQYGVVGNALDQSMLPGPQAMTPMQLMQQQAAIQQHLLQQSAMQHQPQHYQTPGYPLHFMQQQAMQQHEAFQQAAYMQMAGAGGPVGHGSVPPYQTTGFSDYNTEGLGNTQLDQRDPPWTQGAGGQIPRGRGRGRGRYGRGRRGY